MNFNPNGNIICAVSTERANEIHIFEFFNNLCLLFRLEPSKD